MDMFVVLVITAAVFVVLALSYFIASLIPHKQSRDRHPRELHQRKIELLTAYTKFIRPIDPPLDVQRAVREIRGAAAEVSVSTFFQNLQQAFPQAQQRYNDQRKDGTVWSWAEVKRLLVYGLDAPNAVPRAMYQLALTNMMSGLLLPQARDKGSQVCGTIASFGDDEKKILDCCCSMLREGKPFIGMECRAMYFIACKSAAAAEFLLAAHWHPDQMKNIAILSESLTEAVRLASQALATANAPPRSTTATSEVCSNDSAQDRTSESQGMPSTPVEGTLHDPRDSGQRGGDLNKTPKSASIGNVGCSYQRLKLLISYGCMVEVPVPHGVNDGVQVRWLARGMSLHLFPGWHGSLNALASSTSPAAA